MDKTATTVENPVVPTVLRGNCSLIPARGTEYRLGMDKPEFIEKAPGYYALGLVVALWDKPEPFLIEKIASVAYTLPVSSEQGRTFFGKTPLLDAAINLLLEEGALVRIAAGFGPPMYKKSPRCSDWFYKQTPLKFPAFAEFKERHNEKIWLVQAVFDVNKTYDQLKVTPQDFELAKQELEWEPIPLDRDDPKLQEATEKLDEAIKTIEGDNGYAANLPGEREYVLSHLKSFAQTLKTKAEVYGRQIKTDAIDPLTRVAKRFGKAMAGVAATSAREALIEWLKAHWPKLVAWLFSQLN